MRERKRNQEKPRETSSWARLQEICTMFCVSPSSQFIKAKTGTVSYLKKAYTTQLTSHTRLEDLVFEVDCPKLEKWWSEQSRTAHLYRFRSSKRYLPSLHQISPARYSHILGESSWQHHQVLAGNTSIVQTYHSHFFI